MLIDLTHNKIISDTITEGFITSVNSVLVPLVEAIFGDSAVALQMYEDYLTEDFKADGRWCYPFTVLTDEGAKSLWVSWSVDKKRFKSAVPYSYIGEDPIDFAIMDDVPDEFLDKLAGRSIYASADYIKIKLHTASDDVLFLSGKCSQTFIDEMAKQITEALNKAMLVSGLSESCLSLQMIFTPETYMEHTSENVTYRRLRLTDKTSAPRDFWIKWTRTNAAVAYSVSDSPALGTIIFEIGEDVPQKIREKEYRFLLRQDPDKYHSAMSRKNITEWRELVKRAVKRGELVKNEELAEVKSGSADDDALNALLASVVSETNTLTDSEPIFENKDTSLEDALKSILDDPIIEEFENEEVVFNVSEPVLEETEEDNNEETINVFEAAFRIGESSDDEEISEITEDIEIVKTALKIEENKENEPKTAVTDDSREESIRAEIEAKVRLEYESIARMKAEEEAKKLLEEQEILRRENERLQAEAKRAEEIRAREEAERREREERLKAEIEAKVRAEAREKERLAEAAMLAIEEKRRLEAEKAEQMRRQEEDARIKEAERRAAEERVRLEEERRLEAERIRAEAEARIEAERVAMQQSMQSAMAQASKPKYTFTAKRVMFFFRYHVDPNITVPMEAIIRSTLEKEGKTGVPINIKASVVDEMTVCLDFAKIPIEEEDLFIKIVQALGNGNLGISKAKVEQL